MPVADDHVERELLRLRDRVHKLEGTVLAIDLFSGEIRRIETDLRELDADVQELADAVSKLARADEIADAVALRLNERAQLRLTGWQIWGVRAAIAGAIAGGVGEIFRVVHGG